MTKNKAAASTANFGFSEIEKKNNKKSLLIFRAINHKLRQQIIELLEENEKMTVTNLYIKLRLEQSVASQHLAILRRAGVVATERQGKFIYYRVDKDRKEKICKFSEDLQW
jgi:DNA-binding transcriptional ArsR family regulator